MSTWSTSSLKSKLDTSPGINPIVTYLLVNLQDRHGVPSIQQNRQFRQDSEQSSQPPLLRLRHCYPHRPSISTWNYPEIRESKRTDLYTEDRCRSAFHHCPKGRTVSHSQYNNTNLQTARRSYRNQFFNEGHVLMCCL